MAKQQELALSQSKLSGICGRLMCCIAYEYEDSENQQPRPCRARPVNYEEPSAQDTMSGHSEEKTEATTSSQADLPPAASPPCQGVCPAKGEAPSEKKEKEHQKESRKKHSHHKAQKKGKKGKPFSKRKKFWEKKKH